MGHVPFMAGDMGLGTLKKDDPLKQNENVSLLVIINLYRLLYFKQKKQDT